MTRTLLAIPAVLFATTALFVPAAEACISCEYVPEVLHQDKASPPEVKSYHRERVDTQERKSRPVKERTVKTDDGDRDTSVKKAKSAKAAPEKTEDKSVTRTEAENENSAISTAASNTPAAKKVETATTTMPGKPQSENENSTISTATLDTGKKVDAENKSVEEAHVDKNVGCKKFFATVGMTLTVPCE